MSRNSLLLLLAGPLLAACDPPHSDPEGISPLAGYAQRHNLETHTAGVTSNTRYRRNPGGDGPRAERVMNRYREPAADAPADSAPE